MKNEALEVLKNRRSIRQFKAEQVSDETLQAILEAGTYAPTAGGQQLPLILAVQNPEDVAELNRLNGRIMNGDEHGHPYYGAPTILLVLAPAGSFAPVEDCSLIAGNLLNAAYAACVGSCWIHRAKEMFELPEGKALLKKWNIPEGMIGVASIALGYPDCEQPAAAPRKEGYTVIIR